MYEIAKQFDFCYGHRVWSQELNPEFSLDSCLACRHLHGHQGTIIVYLAGDQLQNGMVTDFKHLGWFKKWLDDTLDHKFIMDINDPLINYEVPIDQHDVEFQYNTEYDYYYLTGVEHLPRPLAEKYEGMIFVKFVPTSENLSRWLHEIIRQKMQQINITVSRVQFYETPKSQSNYYQS